MPSKRDAQSLWHAAHRRQSTLALIFNRALQPIAAYAMFVPPQATCDRAPQPFRESDDSRERLQLARRERDASPHIIASSDVPFRT
mgnify:CR=1 FL=1